MCYFFCLMELNTKNKMPPIDKLFKIQKAEHKLGAKDLIHTNHQSEKKSQSIKAFK